MYYSFWQVCQQTDAKKDVSGVHFLSGKEVKEVSESMLTSRAGDSYLSGVSFRAHFANDLLTLELAIRPLLLMMDGSPVLFLSGGYFGWRLRLTVDVWDVGLH
ncbi:hypothetical protein CEXT_472141 [Caerostris extrusa]|uniref:Uncharacterized protein n=1 Tax=Caerostris extrusa TaxID=172846 RepID=A0AAV4MRP3_CAEEX|nr:hypothetical protein CEXT_472141 [Caerostris extrusa]